MCMHGRADRLAGVAAARDRLRSDARSTTSMHSLRFGLDLDRTCTHACVVRARHLEGTHTVSPAARDSHLTNMIRRSSSD